MPDRGNNLGHRRSKSGPAPRRFGNRLFETLEQRRLLAVASMPTQPLNVVTQPIAVESGLIDNNATRDLVVLGSSGDLAVALNGSNSTWQSVRSLDLDIGPAYGMASGLFNADAIVDLVVVGAASAHVLYGDRAGLFSLGTVLNAPAGSQWKPTDNDLAGVAVGLLNSDVVLDIVLLDTASNRVFVWYGRSDGSFATAQSFPSGGIDPISVATGNVVGDAYRDIIVGHRDGTISFLEGSPTGVFTSDQSASLQRAQPIRAVAVADVDNDNDQDVAVSAGTEAFVLRRDTHPLASSPIINGDFARGLVAWNVETVGQQPDQRPGTVSALGGMVQLTEHNSLLTSLSQSFIVPQDPQSISIDVYALGLEYTIGAIPDAFEISLLGTDQQSLVATHSPSATSFFNAVAATDGTPEIHIATGASFNGREVKLDISQLLPGSRAELFFDLVGQPPGDGATVTIDNVSISPSTVFSHSFTLHQLSGPFTLSSGIRIGDVNGDSWTDIVIADRSADRILVFNGSTDG